MDPIFYIAIFAIFIFSVIMHEVSHGLMANYLGDQTAKYEGRLTLNPIPHIDPIGSVILPAFLFLLTRATGLGLIFGWAKPVPINPYNFSDKKWGNLKVAFAGPGSNLLVALIFGLMLRFSPTALFLSHPGILVVFMYIVQINIMLAIFNLLPIPPLDGSHILFTFLKSRKFDALKVFLYQFGFVILLFALAFSSNWLFYIVSAVFHLFTGFPLQ